MKKKIVISIGVLFIISIIALIIVNNGANKENPIPEAFQDETFPKEDEIEEDVVPEEEVDENEDAETIPNRLSESLRAAVSFIFKQDVRIVAIGDSLTQGVGDPNMEGGYVGILDRTMNSGNHGLNITFTNFGKRGNRTDQMLERLEDEEIQKEIEQAQIVLVTIGANDIMQVVKENFTNITLDLFKNERVHFEDRLREILTTIEALNSDADIYLLGIYNPFEKYFNEIEELTLIVSEWNRTSLEVVSELENGTFIPINDLFDGATVNLFAEDNFHPNAIGYHRMAERVFIYLTEER